MRRKRAARQGAASLRQGAGKGPRLPCDGMPNTPLRATLEPAGIRIRTVRGFGYMLEEFKETSTS